MTTGYPRSTHRDPLDEWDRDAQANSEARVVNVSPHVARFEIATVPGTRPRRYRLDPGETVNLQAGYTKSFMGAGRQPVRATIESLTEREVFPKGPRLPQVVHEERALDTQAQWQAAIDAARTPGAPVKVAIPTADGGEPIEALVQPPSIAPSVAHVDKLAASMPVLDEEDQGGGDLDEPPPDHNDPIEVPAAKPARRGR